MATNRLGASQLMSSLGLLVDGPLGWNGQLRSRAPGVFVVELPGGRPSAPIEVRAVRRWLERVPELTLDGARPTERELAQRLARFWLPDEPVLYVGRSARGVGARVAALYATPLGDARPHSGGHWLKTLAVIDELRIWWTETDAHEEYEDALLSAVAERTPAEVAASLPDQPLLPFANLVGSTGPARRHGLEHALRQATDAPATAGRTLSPPATKAARLAAGRPRRSVARRPAPAVERTAPAPTYLSQRGLDDHLVELEQLRTTVRPQVIARVKAARELGDLRENAEYESARKEQSFVEGRIQQLEALVRSAVIAQAGESDVVAVGSSVVVEAEGEAHTFVLVGSSETDPAAGRISYVSPVGRALLGLRAGDEVTVQLPGGERRYRVLEVGPST
jgi:transcription elongation factor GreA